MMLAGWPLGFVHGGPETRHSQGNGCEMRACSERSAGDGPVEDEGPMKQSRRHRRSHLG